MGIVKLRGRTGFIPGHTNIGVYRYRNNFCALVDTGIDNTAARKILKVLGDEGLRVKYIVNTHSHADHFGANNFIRENHTGTQVASSSLGKIFMENPDLEGILLYGASPMPGLSSRLIKTTKTTVDVELTEGPNELGGKKFDLIPLPGHSIDQMGVATEDNVIFCGDAFFSEDKIKKYPFPFVFDLRQQKKTLDYLLSASFDFYVISHFDGILENPKELIQKNIDNIDTNIEIILDYLSQPLTREDIAGLLAQKYQIPMNVSQYFITLSSVSSFLTYLLQNRAVDQDIIDGKMYFYCI